MEMTITRWVIASQASITPTHISPEGNRRHHWHVEDIYAIRRKNLISLCKEKAQDNQSQMARDLGKAASLINRYITGTKDIGDDIAREAEKGYGLEYGWLDNRHPSVGEEALLSAFRNADPLTQQAAARVLGVRLPPEQGTSPFPKGPRKRPQPPRPRAT